MGDVKQIACRLISARADARPVDRDTVKELKDSMARMGMLNAIVVREKKIWAQSAWADGYELIAGRHRLQAAQELGWSEVAATVVEIDDVAAELAMISENLHRADLTALQRDEQVARWIELTGISVQSAPKPKVGRPESGINAASRELGIESTDAKRAVKVASLSQEAKTAAKEVGLDNNRTALLAAADKPKEEQAEFIRDRAKAKQGQQSEDTDAARKAKQRDNFWKMWAKLDNDVRDDIAAKIKALA